MPQTQISLLMIDGNNGDAKEQRKPLPVTWLNSFSLSVVLIVVRLRNDSAVKNKLTPQNFLHSCLALMIEPHVI